MSDNSAIEWCSATWNPTTGCDRISAGCDNCYALTMARRLKAMGSAKYQADGDPRTSGPGFGLALHYDALNLPYTWRTPQTVFVNSMSDLFHARVPLGFVRDVFAVMADTPQHTYQVLTKRSPRLPKVAGKLDWPPNLWMGVSVENAAQLKRIGHLRAVPAAIRFLSLEPLIGPLGTLDLDGIGWVIAGGESGRKARPMHPAWVRSIRDQCSTAGVPFFFKQWGEWAPAPWRVDREPGELAESYKARAEAVCATHSLPVWAAEYGMEPMPASHKPWSLERASAPPEQATLRRAGKHAAGRELDGEKWDEFPLAAELAVTP